MECKVNEIRCKKLEEWLGGVSLEEKIKTLETGRLLTCTKCGLIVFDKEEPNERRRRKCKPSGYEHTYVESEYYIILKRGFVGIIDSVAYSSGTPEEAIIRHFENKR